MANQTLYQPLKGERQTRFLYLQPGKDDEPVVCEIVPGDLNNLKRQYEAVSYTWRASTVTRTICCGGQDFQLRLNPYSLLRQLRYPDKVRILWLDAIVINPMDPDERSAQVSLMNEIYKNAKRLLIWLGEEDSSSNLAMDFASKVQPAALLDETEFFVRQSAMVVVEPKGKSFICDSLPETSKNQRLVQALISLLERPWLRRMWVHQEAAFCADTHVLCGVRMIHWDQLFALCWLFQKKSSLSWPAWIEHDYEDLEPSLIAGCRIQSGRVMFTQISTNRVQEATMSLTTS